MSRIWFCNVFLFSSDRGHQNTVPAGHVYLEALLKWRGPELLPSVEPLHCCWEIVFAITIAEKYICKWAINWHVQKDECGARNLSKLILKALGCDETRKSISFSVGTVSISEFTVFYLFCVFWNNNFAILKLCFTDNCSQERWWCCF